MIGFPGGEVAERPSATDIYLTLNSGLQCFIKWHKIFIDNKEVAYELVKKFDPLNEAHKHSLVIETSSCTLISSKYIGYIEGKRAFIAKAYGFFSPKLYFCGKNSIDDRYGTDAWQFVALLCWWQMYRD